MEKKRLHFLETYQIEKLKVKKSGQWFSLGAQVSSINKTDCHDITKI